VQTLVTDLGSGLATALALGVTIEGGPLAGIAVKAITAGAITTSAYLVGGLLKEAIENGQQTGVAEDESQIRGLATATPQSDPLILVANAPVPQDNFFLTSTGVLDHAMSAVTMASASTPDMLQQVAADGTYTVTAATIGVDIDNVYLSFLHNGEVGLAETLKLSADQSQFAKTTPTEQSLTAIAAGVSEALTGGTQQGAAAFFLQTMLTSELTGPVPYAGLDNLTYYLNTYAFGAQNGPGSIGMYMTDLATGMTASAAYTATTGQAAPK
jgi:hypothetical protein